MRGTPICSNISPISVNCLKKHQRVTLNSYFLPREFGITAEEKDYRQLKSSIFPKLHTSAVPVLQKYAWFY